MNTKKHTNPLSPQNLPRLRRIFICLAFIFLSAVIIIGLIETRSDIDTIDGENIKQVSQEGAARALEDYERVVTNFDELKKALSDSESVTHIYLGDDITRTGGISINSKKPYVIIDGFDPRNPNQTVPHTLTDSQSSAQAATIYLNNAGPQYILIRNLNIVGKNYFGPVSLYDYSSLADITVIYENVDYNGPQLGYHRQGTTRFIDCKAHIHKDNGGSLNQEFSEVKNVIFEGENRIITEPGTYSIFWQPSGGSFTLSDDASLKLTTNNDASIYGVFYADAGGINITVGKRAVLDMTIPTFISYNSYASIKSLKVSEGGSFSLDTMQSSANPVLDMRGDFSVEQGAIFKFNGYGRSTQTAIMQTSGNIQIDKNAVFHMHASSKYRQLIRLKGERFLSFNDPSSVILYNNGTLIDAIDSNGKLHIEAEQLNYWETLTNGGFDSTPLRRVKKADNSNLILNGNISAGKNGEFADIIINSTETDGSVLNTANFHLGRGRVLAFGRLELFVTQPQENSNTIKGLTEPGASVRIIVDKQTFADITADFEGLFEQEAIFLADDLIVVKCYYQYLTAEKQYNAEKSNEGKLEFIVPENLDFFNTMLSEKPQLVKRVNPDWMLVVSDTRGIGHEWQLTVRLVQPLTSDLSNAPPLTAALVWVDEQSETPILINDVIPIYKHQSESSNDTTIIHWHADEGILLRIPNQRIYADHTYTAILEWSINDAP